MGGRNEKDFSFSKWNPETDMINIVLSEQIDKLKKQIRKLESERMNINNKKQKAIEMATSELHSLNGLLEVYLSEMQDRKVIWIELMKTMQMRLQGQMVAFLQYKQIIADTLIPEITSSLNFRTNGAIKLDGQELPLLHALNEVINPKVNFNKEKRGPNKKLQISVEQGMRIVNGSSTRIINHHTGREIKSLLDRIASCQLFWNMPSWLENAIFIHHMSSVAPTRAAGRSASCFVIGSDSDSSSSIDGSDDNQTEKSF